MSEERKNGCYRDTEKNCVAACHYNDTTKPWNFFEGRWGPHGSCAPGQWSVMDIYGFSIAVDDDEFARRFEWLRELDDQDKEPSILERAS